jgi:hypothetical protein
MEHRASELRVRALDRDASQGAQKNSAAPDKDGLFTTRQIVGAVYGGALSEEKLRTQRQITRKLELENAITLGSV